MLSNIMTQIISESEQEPGNGVAEIEVAEMDGIRVSAKVALNEYLSLPLSPVNTFKFWKNYSQTTDRAQRSLCKLARLHLTPPPTSTDTERSGHQSIIYNQSNYDTNINFEPCNARRGVLTL